MTPFYRFSRPTMRFLLWLLTDFHIEGVELVPRSGALIVASNHLHLADPPLLGATLPRFIRFMAKRELFESPVGCLFGTAYGAFPVDREQLDRRAIRQAERILALGGAVGMFPEGHRSHGKGLLPGHNGVALLARRSGALVLPVGIAGTERVFVGRSRWRVSVRVGEPLHVPRGCNLSEATEVVMTAIATLLPDELRGVYAGAGRQARGHAANGAGEPNDSTLSTAHSALPSGVDR